MASIRKRKLPSGKTAWLVDYRDQGGERRYKQFPTKREADSFSVRARSEVAAGTHTPDAVSVTVAEAADMWLIRCERDKLEASTLKQYRAHVKLHIRPFIGETKLSRLSTPTVNSFIDQVIGAGRSLEMARRVRRSLSAIVAHAQSRGLVAANNVLSSTPIKRSKREDVRPEMPTRAELQAIIGATPGRHRAFILTAILAGLRGSELRGLMWKDIDLEKATLTVSRRVDEFGVFGSPKSESGTRDIPLAPLLVNTLKAWRPACPVGELDLVFPNGAGRVESHGNILSRVFWPIQIAAGVVEWAGPTSRGGKAKEAQAKFSLHALRHAAAALWIDQGFGPKKVQTLMGHASIQQTFDQYGYLFESDEDDRKAVDALAVRLVPAPACYTVATPAAKAQQKQRATGES